MNNVFVKLLLLLMFLGSTVLAQLNASDFEKFQLKALKKAEKFGVFVWDIELSQSDTTVAKAFASDTVVSFVTDELISQQLTPISFDEASDLPGGPSLDVLTSITKDSLTNKMACNISVRFVQDVQLTRNVKIMHYSASTWSKNKIFISEPDSLISNYYNELKLLLTDFVKDYKSIN